MTDLEELAEMFYNAAPLWDHGVDADGKYSQWPIAWGKLADYGHEATAKVTARKHAEVALGILDHFRD
jgi:hypothetical protein